MINEYKTIDTLPVVREFLKSEYVKEFLKLDRIILDPWESPKHKFHYLVKNEPYFRIFKEKGPLYFVSVVDVPRQANKKGNLVITSYVGYEGYEDFIKNLKKFLKEKGINAEVEPFKGEEEPYIGKIENFITPFPPFDFFKKPQTL